MNLKKIGNIPKSYEHESRVAVPRGLIKTRKAILKFYDMVIKEGEGKHPIGEAREFIKRKMNSVEGKLELGLGFVILSRDMLNFSLWSESQIILPKQEIYAPFPRTKHHNTKKVSIDEEGAYCIWELGIVAHEKEAWKKYLASEHMIKDKEDYLNNFFNGNL